jgi:hypothetical protein
MAIKGDRFVHMSDMEYVGPVIALTVSLCASHALARASRSDETMPMSTTLTLQTASLVAQLCLVAALQRVKGAKMAVLEYLQVRRLAVPN